MTHNLTNDPLENPKYRDFAARIAAGESQRQARDNAGIGNSAVQRLMKSEKVLNYVHSLRQEFLEEIDVSQQDVLRGFLEAISDAKLLSDPATQIAGWREIGKFQGLYAPDRKEVNVSGSVEHVERKISRMSNEELIEYMEKLDSGEAPIEIEDAEWSEAPPNNASDASGNSRSLPSPESSEETTSSATSAGPAKPKTKKRSSKGNATSGGSKKRSKNAASEPGSG